MPRIDRTFDHVVPKFQGGTNAFDNLRLAHLACNAYRHHPAPTPRFVIVVDAFRAATTACHVLSGRPLDYFLVADSAAARRLAATHADPLLVGRPEMGSDLSYDLPNSPTRLSGIDLTRRTVIHRTSAAGAGVLRAPPGTAVLLAGFVNAAATARAAGRALLTLAPMGHEGATPSEEDELAASCIDARWRGVPFDVGSLAALREGPGRYFFGDDQATYPRADFELCVSVDAFDFAVRAERSGDYARLSRV